MLLLISDANILIDIEEGQLQNYFFELPYKFSIPDILFWEELEEHHAYLIESGLQLASLTPKSIQELQIIVTKHFQPSRNDCMALVLAQQEQCPLLTGDKALRKAAEQEGVEIKGTIWLVEQMLTCQLITFSQAHDAYKRMEESNRRLPFELAYKRLNALESSCS